MAERMLLIRLAVRELRACDRDDRGQGVGEIVDRIEQHGDGIGRETDRRLKSRKQNIDKNAHNTRAHDDFAPVYHFFFDGRHFLLF